MAATKLWASVAGACLDCDIVALYAKLATTPALALTELVNVTALLLVSIVVYAALKVAPAWVAIVPFEYGVYRTRIDDMFAPFLMLFQSTVLWDLLQLAGATAGLASLAVLCYSDPNELVAMIELFLGPHLTPHVLIYLPVVLHQVFIVLRLAGLLLLLQWTGYVLTLPYVRYRHLVKTNSTL
ncbi:hypothetical protein SPRG_00927 [Saprolegnia parasitica CBS 223.65]|uniref:Uncharacterized protein n=1 Tax=Saprolegnia parasitica (strain CBS 223.65) TaxID=695850 RepID=A0A067D783_SAPPC|nr:hypothetical protein SPRG_00927 [Saprolegnia parasitica CBS 223.65]KDO34867.1 hypothetical protein SPRG_00927 [Saprolegnia parasitica CBS 223.65]|eukprot:XP_012194529.1 hypothetical protein SPRG_00927 [Saprolegnia parasitica CBS 223.65]